MTTPAPSFHCFGDRLTATGVHVNLSDAQRHHIVLKAGRLLRHKPRIDRIDVEVSHDESRAPDIAVVARGRVVTRGPDIVAEAAAPDAYAAVSLLSDRLDRALRDRAAAGAPRPFARRRTPRKVYPASTP